MTYTVSSGTLNPTQLNVTHRFVTKLKMFLLTLSYSRNWVLKLRVYLQLCIHIYYVTGILAVSLLPSNNTILWWMTLKCFASFKVLTGSVETVIVWRLRGNIIRTALCWFMWHNVHSPQHTYVSSSYRSNRLGLSHWDPYAVHRGSS